MRKALKIVLINYMVFLTIVFSFELFGQLGYRTIKGFWVWERFEQQVDFFEESPYTGVKLQKNKSVESLHYDAVISSNELGHRITSFDERDTNLPAVFCFGGSTTFGFGLDDSASWPFILQNKFQDQLNIENCGVLGFSAFESLIQSAETFPLNKPQVAIYYLGWNDIKFYYDSLYLKNHGKHGFHLRDYLLNNKMQFSYYFFTPLLVQKIKARFLKSNTIAFDISTSNDPIIDSLFCDRLKMIKSVCESQNVKVIFISQVLNEDSLISSVAEYDSWTPFIKIKNLPNLMKDFNQLIAKTITEDKSCLIIDSLMINYEWSRNDFIDYGHFSKTGSNKFVEIITPQMEEFIRRE